MKSYPRVDFEEVYDDLRCLKEGKEDYYILPKEELLKYEDDLYKSPTPEYNAMLAFVRKHVTDEYVSEMLFSIALAAAEKSQKVLRKVICLRMIIIFFLLYQNKSLVLALLRFDKKCKPLQSVKMLSRVS